MSAGFSFAKETNAEDEQSEESSYKHLLDVKVDIDDIIDGKYRLIYTHPEALLDTQIGMKLLRTKKLRRLVGCIAIDEGHMIQEW